MHKTVAKARELARQLVATVLPDGVEVALCPPFTALVAVGETLRGSTIALGAQNMHEAPQGAFTGEISPVMLRELGVTYVILGHSERRQYFAETDATVARKVKSALEYGIVPIVAVGETADEHAAGTTLDKVVRQTRAALDGLTPGQVDGCVMAYEPIWAIGTGNVDTPEGANSVMGAIRGSVDGLEFARILYGGSMKSDNCSSMFEQPNIDGGLIGGASLALASFFPIIEAAAVRAASV
ncbi:MAG: triose-phosphate isomerase [Candidatus Eremiobacteraeota bacterium]|nr:triose-phosphate isomerase [Candidatus Eremiobacteraeota bacterium]